MKRYNLNNQQFKLTQIVAARVNLGLAEKIEKVAETKGQTVSETVRELLVNEFGKK